MIGAVKVRFPEPVTLLPPHPITAPLTVIELLALSTTLVPAFKAETKSTSSIVAAPLWPSALASEPPVVNVFLTIVIVVGSNNHVPPRPVLILPKRTKVFPEVSMIPPFWLFELESCCEVLRVEPKSINVDAAKGSVPFWLS